MVHVLLVPKIGVSSLCPHVILSRATSGNVVVKISLSGVLQLQDVLSANNCKIEVMIMASSPLHVESLPLVDLPMRSVGDSRAARFVSGSLVERTRYRINPVVCLNGVSAKEDTDKGKQEAPLFALAQKGSSQQRQH